MEITLRESFKKDFKENLDVFCEKLESYVSTENGDWSIKGFIDVYKNIYTISSDTKIVSKILEIHIFPEILLFAEEIGYKIVLAEKQNYYPDLTFINKDNEEVMFAVDMKTTFRRNHSTAGFTLGSHGAYFKERDKKKNIQYPYSQYMGHFCLGVIYSKVDSDDIADTSIYQVEELLEDGEQMCSSVGLREVKAVSDLKSITSVIKGFDFFAAEKWKIASDRQGSGNTANIGSINEIADLKNGNGTFSRLGEEWFDEYWMNHGSLKTIVDGKSKTISNIQEFLTFKNRTDLLSLITVKAKSKSKSGKKKKNNPDQKSLF